MMGSHFSYLCMDLISCAFRFGMGWMGFAVRLIDLMPTRHRPSPFPSCQSSNTAALPPAVPVPISNPAAAALLLRLSVCVCLPVGDYEPDDLVCLQPEMTDEMIRLLAPD